MSYKMASTLCCVTKNYSSPTRVTRLKVAPNMANPISLNGTYRSLKYLLTEISNFHKIAPNFKTHIFKAQLEIDKPPASTFFF